MPQSPERTPQPPSTAGSMRVAERRRTAEVLVAQRRAVVAARVAVRFCAAGFSRSQSGNPVAVRIGPRAGRARRDARHRIGRRVDAERRGGFEVAAGIDLHRRLAVAEQVVGHSQARREVVESGDAFGLRIDDANRREPGRADALLEEVAPRVVVAQRALQRHPSARPLLLCVERGVADAVVAIERHQRLRELIRARRC